MAVGFFQCGGAGTRIENFLALVVNFENGDPINWIHFRMNKKMALFEHKSCVPEGGISSRSLEVLLVLIFGISQKYMNLRKSLRA